MLLRLPNETLTEDESKKKLFLSLLLSFKAYMYSPFFHVYMPLKLIRRCSSSSALSQRSSRSVLMPRGRPADSRRISSFRSHAPTRSLGGAADPRQWNSHTPAPCLCMCCVYKSQACTCRSVCKAVRKSVCKALRKAVWMWVNGSSTRRSSP